MGVHTVDERSTMDPLAGANAAAKAQRLNIRVTREVKALVERAARASRMNASQFVLQAAVRSAEDVLADQTRFTLPPEQWTAFTALLDRPAHSLPSLEEAAGKRRPFDDR